MTLSFLKSGARTAKMGRPPKRGGGGSGILILFLLYIVDNVPANHCVPTDNYGTECGQLNTDNYIENCNLPASRQGNAWKLDYRLTR